jgi:dCTP deaminase
MILSDTDIREMLASGRLKIEPLNKKQIGPASIDLTLSDEWQFFKKKLVGSEVELSANSYRESFTKVRSKSVLLEPGQMCLGKTVEKLTLPEDIMGKLEGRSRFARMGLVIHITSALVQPGSSNRQVLEIVNLAPFSLKLHAGIRISQVVFERLESPTSRPYRKFGEIAKKQ